MGIRLTHAAATDVGLVRKQNEDAYVAMEGIYAVCDGMGGARAGEVASSIARGKLVEVMQDDPSEGGLRRAVRAANREIYRMSLADPALQGMGTTMTAALARPEGVTLAQVGDSRAYLWRDGRLDQLTEDHSLVADLVRRGQLTPEQAAVHPHRSVITRALGTEEAVEPDLLELDLLSGDRLLLCTDGLTGMVSDEGIAAILAGEVPVERMAEDLLAAALREGGEDNITVIVVHAEEVEGEGTAMAAALSAGGPDDTIVGGGPARPPTTASDAAQAAYPAKTPRGDSARGPARGTRSPAEVRRRRLFIGLAAVILVLAVALGGFVVFNSTVYWVGTAQGNVSLYQGMPYKVMGVALYDLVETTGTSYESLGDHVKGRVDTRELVTKEEGQRFIRSLQAPAVPPASVPTTATTLPRPTTTTIPQAPFTTLSATP